MCTVVVLFGVNPEHPLIVAANRDELYARPFAPPAEVAPGIYAPRDLVLGGSWMGATADGFFVGLTNIHTPSPRRPGSRGTIVMAALRAGGVDAATEYVRGLRLEDFGPFNLIYGDAARLRVAHAPAGTERAVVEEVAPGLHVLPNAPLNAPLVPKVERARALVGPVMMRPWAELAPLLHRALGDHEGETPLSALCVHTEMHGTSSSTLLAIDEGRTARYLFANGPPCVTSLTSVSLPT